MKRAAWMTLVVLVLLLPQVAQAKLLDIYGGVRAGGMTGGGASGLSEGSEDFFKAVRGPGIGGEVGVEIVLIDVMVNFTQLFDGRGRTGTLTQMLLGFDGDIPLDLLTKPRAFLRLGVAGGVALGTHRPVQPPLDNGQVSDKGFVAQATAALEYHMSDYVIMGLELDGGYHYMFAGGDNVAGTTNQSHGGQFMGFFTLRAHFEPFQ